MTKVSRDIRIPVYRPSIEGNEKTYVNQCLDSSWISSRGEFVTRFEESFAATLGVSGATSVSNGTVALHLALLALGVSEGDEVIVPTLTYIASVNAISYVGAKPVFIDSDPVSWNLDPALIEERITERTKAVMAVHLYGAVCDMGSIRSLCDRHGLRLIEDVAEAFGSRLGNSHAGTFGDVATFSFFGNKTITTGEGGMVAAALAATKISHLQNLCPGQGSCQKPLSHNLNVNLEWKKHEATKLRFSPVP